MAFPTTTDPLTIALTRVMAIMRSIKNEVNNDIALMAASSVTGDFVIGLHMRLGTAKTELNRLASTPGIGQFAKDQFSDAALDVAAEFMSVVNAISAVNQWIFDNFPKDAGGFILKDTINPDGTKTMREFTPAETAGLRTQLTNLSNTIS